MRNLGVILDQDLSFNSHIKTVSRSAFYYLWKCKDQENTDPECCWKASPAFVTSSLDDCYSLLSGCPKNSLRSLQLIRNAAARILTGDHMTAVLVSLKPPPIKSGIVFKLLLLTYKVFRGQAPSSPSGGANNIVPSQWTAALSGCWFSCGSQGYWKRNLIFRLLS